MFLGREAPEDHSQLPKKANKCSLGAVASFSYVWRHRHVRVKRVYRLSDIYVYAGSISICHSKNTSHFGNIWACTPLCHGKYITSVKIIKNEEGCGDDTVPKTVETRGTARWIESMQQSSATPKNRDVGRGLQNIVACSQSTLQCLLVSTVFGTVSSPYPSSFLMIFTLVSLIFLGNV